MDGFESYVGESIAPAGRKGRRLSVYLGLAVLLAAASLVAVTAGGEQHRRPRIKTVMPASSGGCDLDWSKSLDGVAMHVCFSREGNINSLNFPSGNASDSLIGFRGSYDGYCMRDATDPTVYTDFPPGSGLGSAGFGPATLTPDDGTLPAGSVRETTDGKFQLTQYLSANLQPRSVFVGMTVKNLSRIPRRVVLYRFVHPLIGGDASDEFIHKSNSQPPVVEIEQLDQFGQRVRGLLFGPTQSTGQANQADEMNAEQCDHFTGFGGQTFQGSMNGDSGIVLNPGQSANFGKFVYRVV